MIDAILDRIGRRGAGIAVAIALLNLWALLPSLSAVGQVVAVPAAFLAAFAWVWVLQTVWRAIGRVSARVA